MTYNYLKRTCPFNFMHINGADRGGMQMSEPITVFICGTKGDHKCNDDGPTIYGGPEVVATTDASKAGKGYTWGSVSCSKCGSLAIERSYFEDCL